MQFVARSGDPNYTGSVWVDQVMVRGVAESVQNGTYAPAVTTSLAYGWAAGEFMETSAGGDGVSQTITYRYDEQGRQIVTTNPLSVSYDDGTTEVVDPATLPATEPESPVGGSEYEAQAIIGQDDRERVYATEKLPASAIVHVVLKMPNGRITRCSGWMSSNDTVITAGHCLYSHQSPRGWRTVQVVIPGRDGDQWPFGHCGYRARVVPTAWKENKGQRYDYGAVHLNCKVGDRTGWFRFPAVTQDRSYRQSILAGYPRDKPLGTQWKSYSSVQNQGGGILYFWNDNVRGNSGGPVWQYNSDICTGRCVIGMATNSGYPNYGPLMTQSFTDAIRRWNSRYD